MADLNVCHTEIKGWIHQAPPALPLGAALALAAFLGLGGLAALLAARSVLKAVRASFMAVCAALMVSIISET